MQLGKLTLSPKLHEILIRECFDVIGAIQYVHKKLGPALPEYVYQEALYRRLLKLGMNVQKEYQHHPLFDDEVLDSYIKMDLVVFRPDGNIIIECKSIASIGDREQLQTYGYLNGTGFPLAILVNFGTYPKAQVQRYYHEGDDIVAF